MEKELEKLFGFSRDAVVALRDNCISFANAAAEELFAVELSGKSEKLLPEHLTVCDGEHFVAAATVNSRSFSVSGSRLENTLVLRFTEEAPRLSGDFFSRGLQGALGNALVNLNMSIDLLSGRLAADGDEKSKQHLAILYRNYYELRRLIGNLGTAADLSTGALSFQKEGIDLVQLCGDLVASLRVMLERPVELSFRTNLSQLYLQGDPIKLERMIINLITNSYLAVTDGGHIQLELKQRSRWAVLTVSDNGRGIAPEILKNVFSRFEPEADSFKLQKSAGLGLSIAKGIAEGHGGSILLESREGEGSRVYVTLPTDSGKALRLRAPLADNSGAMDRLLTELAGVLSYESYTEKFLD